MPQVLRNQNNLDVKLGKRKRKILSLPRYKNEIQKLADESSVLSFLLENADLSKYDYIVLDDPIYESLQLSDMKDSESINDFLLLYKDDMEKIKKAYSFYDKSKSKALRDAFKETDIESLFKNVEVKEISKQDEDIEKLESDKNKLEVKNKFVESIRNGSDYLVDISEAKEILGLEDDKN